MTKNFDYGLVAGVLLMVAADAAHWFITPHADASSARTLAVIAQALVGLIGAAWLVKTKRRST